MFAPVIIPTLNRDEHLKQCIMSLQNNKLAKETDLYISVDYPPNEKYREGYEKVLEYVNKGINGFKNVYLYFQKDNLGPFDNATFLQKIVLEKYEKYIFTEDDNVFSPNFLEYMNQCLNKYKDDDSIFAIGGYSYPINWAENKDSLIMQSLNFPAWGYGIWKKEYDEEHSFTRQDVYHYIKNVKNALFLYQKSRRLFNQAVYIAAGKHYLAFDDNDNLQYIDSVSALYMIINGKRMIIPSLSKVRNMGHDGSGLNCKESKKTDLTSDSYNFAEQVYDENNDFLLQDAELIEENNGHVKKLRKYFPVSFRNMIKTWILWMLLWFYKD